MERASSLATWFGIGVMALALIGMVSDASARGRTGAADVDCDAGDSLNEKLSKGFDGMTFNVAGLCDEIITVELNNVVIDGTGLDPARRANITFTGGDANPGLVLVRGQNALLVRVRQVQTAGTQVDCDTASR